MEKEKIRQLQIAATLYGDEIPLGGFWSFTAREMALAVAAYQAWWAVPGMRRGGADHLCSVSDSKATYGSWPYTVTAHLDGRIELSSAWDAEEGNDPQLVGTWTMVPADEGKFSVEIKIDRE